MVGSLASLSISLCKFDRSKGGEQHRRAQLCAKYTGAAACHFGRRKVNTEQAENEYIFCEAYAPSPEYESEAAVRAAQFRTVSEFMAHCSAFTRRLESAPSQSMGPLERE